MNPETFTAYLHRHIPLTAAMQVRVLRCEAGVVEIAAPLEANLNVHGSAFAGSIATLGVLCGWALMNRALSAAQLEARVVAQRSECAFLAPATENLLGVARVPEDPWARFTERLRTTRRARLRVVTEIRSGARLAATHTGVYAVRR